MIMPPNSPAVAGSDAINTWVGQMLAMPDFNVSWTANNAVVAGSGDAFGLALQLSAFSRPTLRTRYRAFCKQVTSQFVITNAQMVRPV
jgi:hypothetical protein